MGKWDNKVCCICKQDVSRRYRLKDTAGRYYCDRCFSKLGTRSAASHLMPVQAASVATKGPAVKSSSPEATAPAGTPATTTCDRNSQPETRDVFPDAREQYVRACKSVSEIVAAADGLLTLWSELIESEDEKRVERHPDAVERRDELFAATRKWLEQERRRLGIDETTADVLENGENPFDATSTKCFLR
jgi:hypothetical protein